MITRFGIAPLTGPFVDDYRLIKAAEEAGFESGWTNDGSINGYVRLAAYASQTARMKFGTGAAIQPLRNIVTHVAAARDLSEMSNGRVILGIGSGVKGQLNQFFGIYGDQAEHPAPRIREFITLYKLMMSPANTGPVHFEGRFFRLSAGRARPPKQPVPIFVAAVNTHMLHVTGDLADGLIGHPINSYEYLKDVLVPTIEDRLAAAGRSRADFDMSGYVLTSINEDRELAKRDVAISLGFYLSPRAFDCIFDASGWDEEKVTVRQAFRTGNLENLATAVTERMLDSCCLYGTADEVKEKINRFDGLLDQVILYSPGHLVPNERQYANFHRIVDTFRQ